MKKIILIDGNNFMFRSYFATAYSGSLMRNTEGQATNALYGFITMINKIIKEENPTHMVVAFDIGKNFRHDMYDEYKAGRNATPDDLKSQMPIAKTLLDAMGIKHVEVEGFEADDIIGTLAREADEDPEFEGLIISSDHDLLQLISPDVRMKMLRSKDSTFYTEESFIEEYGFEPIKIIDLKSLMGDASDNIPGVKGIGEKTAKSLIQKYRTLDGVYENIEEIKGKLKEKLEIDRDNAYFSYKLATICRDVPMDKSLSKFVYNGPNIEELKAIYTELEFHSFIRNLNNLTNDSKKLDYIYVKDIRDIDLNKKSSYFIECDNDNYHYANILGMSIYDGNKLYYIDDKLCKDVILKCKDNLSYTYALKKNIVLLNRQGITDFKSALDTMLVYYLVDNNIRDDISIKMLDEGIECYSYEDLIKGKIEKDDFINGILKKSKFIFDQKENLYKRLESEDMVSLYNDIEHPLVYVLADMEINGIRVDKDILIEMQGNLKSEIDLLEDKICSIAGEKFNVASPKQLASILFDKLEIPYPIKNKKTISTDANILMKLVDKHEIINYILKYRTLSKLYNTYVEPLEGFIEEDNKIHTIYKQTLTRTGRLSSVYPNLQNIPTRDEEGRLIKKAFLSDDNSVLLSADYSQIELRILAHISDDEKMIKAFIDGEDIHKTVASEIYSVPINEVTKLMRSTAKHVIFGIVYGISGFGLGENLNINPKDAKEYILKYYEKYPKVKEYMDNIKKQAYLDGFVKTLFNRKRVIDELRSPVYTIRTQGERIALNTPIQGTGADIIKKAMVNLYRELNQKNMKSKILLQVHDEIIMNVKLDELSEIKDIVRKNMENVVEFKVPLKVEIETGKDWYETK